MKPSHLEKQRNRWNTLIERGKAAGRNKDLKSVGEYFETAYKVSRAFAKKDAIRRDSAYFLAYVKFESQKNQEACALFEEFLAHPLIDEADKMKVAGALSVLGTINYDTDTAKAAQNLEKAIKLQMQLGIETLENEIMLGAIRMIEHKYAEAITLLEPAYQKVRDSDRECAKRICLQLAFAHKELGDNAGEMKWQKANLLMSDLKTSHMSEKNPLIIRTEVPEGWGKDSLSHFVESSRQNELATFQQMEAQYLKLRAINDRFMENRKSFVLSMIPAINQQYEDFDFEKIELKPEEWLEAFFFLRTHASFSGAARMALSAQIPEMYMLLRGCIENAIYGFYVWKKPELKTIWLKRNDSAANKEAVKDKFTVSKIMKTLGTADSGLRDEIAQMYDETIDQGAHPNVKAFLAHGVQKNEDGALSLAVNILNPGELNSSLENLAKTGDLVLKVFKAMYPVLID